MHIFFIVLTAAQLWFIVMVEKAACHLLSQKGERRFLSQHECMLDCTPRFL